MTLEMAYQTAALFIIDSRTFIQLEPSYSIECQSGMRMSERIKMMIYIIRTSIWTDKQVS